MCIRDSLMAMIAGASYPVIAASLGVSVRTVGDYCLLYTSRCV